MRSRTALCVAAVVTFVLAGCTQPEVPGDDREVVGVAPEVVEPETPLAPPSTTSPSGIDAPADGEAATSEATPGPDQSGGKAPEARGGDGQVNGGVEQEAEQGDQEAGGTAAPRPVASPSVERVPLVVAGDRAGDHGLEGPPHADLRQLTMTSVGNDAELTASFDAELPLTAEEGEVMLVNIRLPEDDGDDEYVFTVTFNADGWLVYLDTPEGVVQYPGDFVIGGDTLMLRVPWSSLGSPTRGTVEARVEWSKDDDRSLVVDFNPSSNDPLDAQPHTFDRSS